MFSYVPSALNVCLDIHFVQIWLVIYVLYVLRCRLYVKILNPEGQLWFFKSNVTANPHLWSFWEWDYNLFYIGLIPKIFKFSKKSAGLLLRAPCSLVQTFIKTKKESYWFLTVLNHGNHLLWGYIGLYMYYSFISKIHPLAALTDAGLDGCRNSGTYNYTTLHCCLYIFRSIKQ